MKPTLSVRTLWPLAVALALYAALALPNLHLPGLHHDEAQEAGLQGMQLLTGQPPTLFRDVALVVNNRAFPVMVQDYIGAANAYFAWLAFGVGGVSVESLRAMTVLTGALTLILGYGAARELGGARLAAIFVLLLAVQPAFIFWTRQGVYVTSYTITLAFGALWLLARWWRGGPAYLLSAAAFLMGLGLWGKLLFVWFMGGVFLGWLVLNAPRLLRWLRARDTLRPDVPTPAYTIPVAMIAGLLGLAPLIYYNAESGGTLDNIFNNFDQSYYGVDNRDVGANLRERVRQAPLVFESGHLRELGGQFRNPLARAWLLGAGLVTLGAALATRQKRGVRLFVLILSGAMVAQSSFTSTALWFTHFALIVPFLVLLGAVGADALLDLWPRGRYVLAAALSIFIAYEAVTALHYHQALRQTGGIDTHTGAIYALHDALGDLPPGHPVAALDWGISPAVTMLSEGCITPNEVFGYTWAPDPGFAGRLGPFLALDASVYVLHAPGQEVFPRREAFLSAAQAAGRDDLTPQEIIRDARGVPVFELWSAGPLSRGVVAVACDT